ncbi:MAG: Ig-like domain-containing protein, partial [Planctomycetota bacterium]
SGVAALVIAAKGGSASPDEVRQALQSTAEDKGNAGWDSDYGHGIVDAAAAVGTGTPSNDPPTVSITDPADGSIFDSGASISFAGTASDTEDGDLTASLAWTSDKDGQIGTGGSFSTTLSDGTHTITASVTDSGGKTASDSITITVGTPVEPTTVSVDSVSYNAYGGRENNKHLDITVALVDDLGNPVGGASVSIDVSLNGDSYASDTGTTGDDGTVTFGLKNIPFGTYTTKVTDVVAAGLTWDEVTPANSYEKK